MVAIAQSEMKIDGPNAADTGLGLRRGFLVMERSAMMDTDESPLARADIDHAWDPSLLRQLVRFKKRLSAEDLNPLSDSRPIRSGWGGWRACRSLRAGAWRFFRECEELDVNADPFGVIQGQPLNLGRLSLGNWSSPGFVDSYGLTDSSRSRVLLS